MGSGVGAGQAPKLERGMAHEGKTQREAVERTTGPAPHELKVAVAAPADNPTPMALHGRNTLGAIKPGGSNDGAERNGRRPAKRRPAGPARPNIAANDDAPSIGGLIFALQQKPSN